VSADSDRADSDRTALDPADSECPSADSESADSESADSESARFELHSGARVPIKAWTRGVPVEPAALQQLRNIASLPIVHRHVAAMPDVHVGRGATVGSVIPTLRAVIPAAVGVDIGCGMVAVRTGMLGAELPDNLKKWRAAIEKAVPHGFGKAASHDRGGFREIPRANARIWKSKLLPRYEAILDRHRSIGHGNDVNHLGSLGSGNHFIELCLDEEDRVWLMLHSGSRGVGNRIGRYFTELAREDAMRQQLQLPDRDLAYFREGSDHFDDYIDAVGWAQHFARFNRDLMVEQIFDGLKRLPGVSHKKLLRHETAVNCHHNYVQRESHFGEEVLVTRKGAVEASEGTLGIIPGSMGARSFIVRGKGNPESFRSCSHGAGRKMSRSAAKRTFSLDDHLAATAGVECRKDAGVLDETPGAYKDIDAVMAAQDDLVEVVHTLKQVLCVKG